ncbi:hypothetical protein DXB23_08665 [Dorea sp. OM02-2LB]|nr:hypothetical protein DXB23_08665 [Dorea sp. OM02-2LB]RGV98507.1 hypothetical protein DWV97_01720 [Ruminococcus sp. AF14-10]
MSSFVIRQNTVTPARTASNTAATFFCQSPDMFKYISRTNFLRSLNSIIPNKINVGRFTARFCRKIPGRLADAFRTESMMPFSFQK